ncbi:P-loop containing nucleoside triphosphate hydrolase protein [Hypoxylon rubiginosum]|uniref:P-loop containing nucleoside triphosphate hydrolase protein n=1 Tax=Hypoxylon rubiginosum TaxID=110542 RepID=A0ACB9Z1H1_9PEZI|nr:P-loop containing nucleoside triphosphate hydrolase protein [Hypoxylon rubiginosum]
MRKHNGPPEGHAKTMTTISNQPAIIHWESLCLDIKTRQGKRSILKDVDGWVKPGTLTALMGVTGAGKTTLLDVLAQRVNAGVVIGNMYVNGRSRGAGFQRRLGYVQQDDIHLPTATVREALQFSANLRQPCAVSRSDKMAYVESTIQLLNMEHYADAIIGLPGEGLNVEQRKTLSIAIEMAAKPELLLFLDEPTSSLDSQMAWSICTLLGKLAASGQTVLCTIHQPSSQKFSQGGASVMAYFERNGAPKFQKDDNPAEWILTVTQNEAQINAEGEIYSTWAETWYSSDEKRAVQSELARLRMKPQNTTEVLDARSNQEYTVPVLRQIPLVFKRMLQDQWRDPVYLYCKIALCICQALVNGISFYKTSHDAQGLVSLLFAISLMAQMFNSVSRLITLRFVGGRDLFEALFASWYYPTGLYLNGTAERSALAFILLWLFILWSGTFCQAFAAGFSQSETAVQVATLCFWLSIVFGG